MYLLYIRILYMLIAGSIRLENLCALIQLKQIINQKMMKIMEYDFLLIWYQIMYAYTERSNMSIAIWHLVSPTNYILWNVIASI